MGLIAAIGLCLLLSSMAPAQADRSLPSPGDPAWAPLRFPGIAKSTRFDVEQDPSGRPAYRATSECGASAMRLALPRDVSADETPRLAWRWRIEEPLDVANEQTRAGDDFAARVYVLFPFEPERAGPMERLQRRIGKALFGVSMPGKSLSYVFSSRTALGESWTSPYHTDARLIAVGRADAATAGPAEAKGPGIETDGWSEVVVDWTADRARLFSAAPAATPYAIAIMVDSDSVCERAVAWFSDFRLLGP